MGLVNKVLSFFGVKMVPIEDRTKLEDSSDLTFTLDMIEVIHVNPNVYLAHRGSRICIGKGPINGTIKDQMNNVEKVMGRGHESVSEHTNAIVLWKLPLSYIRDYSIDFADMMSNMNFLKVVPRENNDTALILVGGSVRAWLHLLREMRSNNLFKPLVQNTIYNTFEKCFLAYPIKHNLLDESKCTYLPDGKMETVLSAVTNVKNDMESREAENYDEDCHEIKIQEIEGEHVDLVYKTPITKVYNKVKDYSFTLLDIYTVSTLTLIFHDISRTCSHQLVRHRNGISQESQRYVTHDYRKDKDFIDPVKMNLKDRYSDKEFEDVLERIEDVNPFKMYSYLISNKVLKEDARAWLPSNVTTKLIMTFTYYNYAKFLYLRMDKAAQKEIRIIAEESIDHVMDMDKLPHFLNYVLTPKGLSGNQDGDPLLAEFDGEINTDEIVSEEEIGPGMIVKTEEDAKKLFDLQEKYKNDEV